MYRHSARRLGHQLIKEPMGHEATTFGRGDRTRQNAIQHVYGLAAFCGAGCVLALFSFVSGQRRVQTTITADGAITKGTCPTKWWNF
ncbi:unspecified product [Leptomonas pyrrhocoris]|uniref:Unspecified product n=1 Tax=Leptomonas pyrrhocoris TaxID=157538 RepID=A0A0M9FTG4_LEPPY|nr:unspecified product [Leptomonas pyrrhocoris]XP_015654067.1 unspecified product [Leptomonas pyrrhocoris]KPA75627.1 unspecified product [Leptomonas pyrrhocoris]KPA75628.1 unspecified product [Leptomonas pyrrhocoris]|eukprot:XP_015654066.1 unspecified product [Leptomonas pyrrhocoris]